MRTAIAYPNGLTAFWQYDANNQLLQVCNATPTNIISQFDYTYDAAGRRIAMSKSGSAMAQADTIDYAYNSRSELTNALARADADYNYAYVYDDIGNRISSTERGTNTVYTANELNQYAAIDDFTPEFDADGNQTLVKTETGIWRITYNGENRPVSWKRLSDNIEFVMSYDHQGRRRQKNDQHFFYDRYLQIMDDCGHGSVWDPCGTVATRALCWWRFVSDVYTPFFYTHDGNKNVSELVVCSHEGETAAHYEYDAFGVVMWSNGDLVSENPWRFSSEFSDVDTSTIYYNFRHYEPKKGRWLSFDPLEEKGGINLYIACNNDMFSRTDSLGRNPVAVVAVETVVAAAIAALSFVAIEISQSVEVSGSLTQVLNDVVSGLESCLESIQQLAQDTSVAVPDLIEEAQRIRKQACDELNNVVQQTKKDVGSLHPARCDCSMSCYELARRKNAWLAEGVARAQRDVLCWDCGDEGHQQQQADVWQHVGRCFTYWTFKCSWR